MRGILLLAGSALFLATGCSSYIIATPATPPRDPGAAVPLDAAEICVVRPASTGPQRGPVTHVVRDNGQLAGATRGEGYFCYGARPGQHRLTSEVGLYTETLDLTLAPGERRFVQQSFATHEGVSLALLGETEARAALVHLPFQELVAAPEPVRSSMVAASSLLEAPLPAPEAPRRRAAGMVFGAAAGLGLATVRASPASGSTGGFGALGSIWAGLTATDVAVLALRVDAADLAGATVADLALHLAIFPGAGRSGPVSDLRLFADGGVRIPTGQATAQGAMGSGRLGVGWERWRLGPAVVGPFLCGQIMRGGGEADAALFVGLGASLYSSASRRAAAAPSTARAGAGPQSALSR